MLILGTGSTQKKFSWGYHVEEITSAWRNAEDSRPSSSQMQRKNDQASGDFGYSNWLSGTEVKLPFEVCTTQRLSSVFVNSACYNNIPITSGLIMQMYPQLFIERLFFHTIYPAILITVSLPSMPPSYSPFLLFPRSIPFLSLFRKEQTSKRKQIRQNKI